MYKRVEYYKTILTEISKLLYKILRVLLNGRKKSTHRIDSSEGYNLKL